MEYLKHSPRDFNKHPGGEPLLVRKGREEDSEHGRRGKGCIWEGCLQGAHGGSYDYAYSRKVVLSAGKWYK